MRKRNLSRTAPVALVILDGWGYRREKRHNAIAEANTPFFDALWRKFPHNLLGASGEAVGLPEGQIGNSEIGHMTIGTGTVMESDIVRINKSVKDGSFAKNPVFLRLFGHVKKHNSVLHVQGLVSPGGVHSHINHLFAFLHAAKQAGVKKLAVHAFTDGRDVPPRSAARFLSRLEKILGQLKIGHIATVSGRFYAMDRDQNWHRTKQAEDAILHGKGKILRDQKPSRTISGLYNKGVVDEHIKPLVFLDEKGNSWKVKKGDAVFFFNFRADRARQISQRILKRPKVLFATMTQYDPCFKCPVAFPPKEIKATLASEVAKAGLKQAHIAETEKYGHVTYYFNGGREKPHRNERHILIPSRKDVPTHDLAPKMRAKEIADAAVNAIAGNTNFLVLNFANADMVGHTAKKTALLEALEEVDRQLERIVKAIWRKDGIAIITADHGNAEIYHDQKAGQEHTAHTTNPVPFIITKKGLKIRRGTLADIAPTVLKLLRLPKPKAMTGQSLI